MIGITRSADAEAGIELMRVGGLQEGAAVLPQLGKAPGLLGHQVDRGSGGGRQPAGKGRR